MKHPAVVIISLSSSSHNGSSSSCSTSSSSSNGEGIGASSNITSVRSNVNTFDGYIPIAGYIPGRKIPLQLPFLHSFNMGIGRRMYTYGTLVSNREWYQLSQQDTQVSFSFGVSVVEVAVGIK